MDGGFFRDGYRDGLPDLSADGDHDASGYHDGFRDSPAYCHSLNGRRSRGDCDDRVSSCDRYAGSKTYRLLKVEKNGN